MPRSRPRAVARRERVPALAREIVLAQRPRRARVRQQRAPVLRRRPRERGDESDARDDDAARIKRASLSDTDANVIALNSNLLTAIANTASNTVTNASLVSGLRADDDVL